MTNASLFDPAGAAATIARIESLAPGATRRWGKMDAGQMLAHCAEPLRIAVGDRSLARGLIGLLFGRMAKRKFLASGEFRRDGPTHPSFVFRDARDVAVERPRVVELVRRFSERGPRGVPAEHPFFGPMTPEEWDALMWKHLDHHLRQFGA